MYTILLIATVTILYYTTRISRLLARGVDINTTNTHTGETALMIAITYMYVPLITFLLEHGADVTIQNITTGNVI